MKTVSGKDISKIGIGSYGIGGRGHRDMTITEKQDDEIYIKALVYTLNRGINFSEIAIGYGQGQALPLFKKALDASNLRREDFFLTHSLYPRDLPDMDVVQQDTDTFYDIMKTTYADSTLVDASFIRKFGEKQSYSFLHRLLSDKKTRFVSLSNGTPDVIKVYKQEFGESFSAHEGHLSFEVRKLQDNKTFELCTELGVTNIIWRPLRRGKTFKHNWPLLQELATTYQRTQNQIVLNWICHLGYHPMVMSADKHHIDENISATEFVMSDSDYERMSAFRPKITAAVSEYENSIVSLTDNFEQYEAREENPG